MEIKAKLKVLLLANDVIVAESDNSALWYSVLQISQGAAIAPKLLTHQHSEIEENLSPVIIESKELDGRDSNLGIQKMARVIGVSSEEIEGACYPTLQEPYLNIDQHYWAAFKKNIPEKGPGSISAAAIVTTLMLQWYKYAILGDLNKSVVYTALKTLGITTKNFDRNIKVCSWLSIHGDTLKLNPSAINHADALVKAFCTKQPMQLQK